MTLVNQQSTIKYIVRKLIEYCKSTNDPFEIARKLNITVNITELDNVKAFSEKINPLSIGTIYISKYVKSNYARKILCAHELGHLIMHSNTTETYVYNMFDKKLNRQREYQANYFAAALLKQQMDLKQISKLSIDELNNLISTKVDGLTCAQKSF